MMQTCKCTKYILLCPFKNLLAIQECGKLIPCHEESHMYNACAITDLSLKLTDWSCFNHESHPNNQERLKLFEAWKYCILIWEEKSTQHVLLDLKFVDLFFTQTNRGIFNDTKRFFVVLFFKLNFITFSLGGKW